MSQSSGPSPARSASIPCAASQLQENLVSPASISRLSVPRCWALLRAAARQVSCVPGERQIWRIKSHFPKEPVEGRQRIACPACAAPMPSEAWREGDAASGTPQLLALHLTYPHYHCNTINHLFFFFNDCWNIFLIFFLTLEPYRRWQRSDHLQLFGMFVTDMAETRRWAPQQPWAEVLTSPVLEDERVNGQKSGRDEHLLIRCQKYKGALQHYCQWGAGCAD